jgi:hypothetical protein
MSNRGGDRRREPRVMGRYEARVEVGTAILNQEIGTGSLGPLTLYGHTRDLSPSGLGIVIPRPTSGRHTAASTCPPASRSGSRGMTSRLKGRPSTGLPSPRWGSGGASSSG